MQRIFFILMGPPGSGKGTQAKELSAWLGMPTVSVGNLLRHEEEAGTPLGKEIKPLIDKGNMAPDPIIEAIVTKRLQNRDTARGVIFDGYPRTKPQLNYFVNNFLAKRDTEALAILIMVSDKEVMNRLSGRRVCDCGATYHILYNPPKRPGICDKCGRKLYIRHDDKPEVIAKRLAQYHQLSAPLIGYWRRQKKLVSINGEQPIKEVQDDIRRAIIKKFKKLRIET